MKNLKKVLAMVLAFACTFSMFAGAKVFEDVPAGSDYSEAVTMLSDLGIIQGKDDGKYHPEDTITRAEACAMIARLMTGDPNVSQYVGAQSFTDVAKGSWKDSAIGYCYINGIVIGVGNNKFEPDRAITDAEFITMVVRAMGYETADMKQNYPYSYMSNAQAIGLLDGTNMVASTDALRGEDAQVIYNALFTDYARGAKLVNTTHGTSVETYPTLAESVWGLTRAAAGTWKEKDDETATLEYCKAHTWVVLGADTANEGHILAYPISDSDGDLYAMGKGVEAVSFKYDGDASAVAGYQVELWGEGSHGEPEWNNKEGKYVYSDDWTIKAIKTVKGQTAYDYNASMADSKSDNGEIVLGEETLDLDAVAANASEATAKYAVDLYVANEYNETEIKKAEDVEEALNIRDGAQYKLMDWDSDGDIDWVVASQANYFKVETANSKRVTVVSMKTGTGDDFETETKSNSQTWKLDDTTTIDGVDYDFKTEDTLEEGDIVEVTYGVSSDDDKELVTATITKVEAEAKSLDKVSTKGGLTLTFDDEEIAVAQNYEVGDTIVPANPAIYRDFNGEELGTEFALYMNRNGFIVYSDYATDTANYAMVLDVADGSDKAGDRKLAVVDLLLADNSVKKDVELTSGARIQDNNGDDLDNVYSSREFKDQSMVVGNVYKYWMNEDGQITRMQAMFDDETLKKGDTSSKYDQTDYTYKSSTDRLQDAKGAYVASLEEADVIFAVKGDDYIDSTDADDLVVDSGDVMAVKYDQIPDINLDAEDTDAVVLDKNAEGWLNNKTATFVVSANGNKAGTAAMIGVENFNKFDAGSTKLGLVTNVSYTNSSDGKYVEVEAAVNGKVETFKSANKVDFDDIVEVQGFGDVKSESTKVHNGVFHGTRGDEEIALDKYLEDNAAYAEITMDADGKVTKVSFLDTADGYSDSNALKGDYYTVERRVVTENKSKSFDYVDAWAHYAGEKKLYSVDRMPVENAGVVDEAAYYIISGRPTRADEKYDNNEVMTVSAGFAGTPDIEVSDKASMLTASIDNRYDSDTYYVADIAFNGDGDIVAMYSFDGDMGETADTNAVMASLNADTVKAGGSLTLTVKTVNNETSKAYTLSDPYLYGDKDKKAVAGLTAAAGGDASIAGDKTNINVARTVATGKYAIDVKVGGDVVATLTFKVTAADAQNVASVKPNGDSFKLLSTDAFEVEIVDQAGDPIENLTAADFTFKVNGVQLTNQANRAEDYSVTYQGKGVYQIRDVRTGADLTDAKIEVTVAGKTLVVEDAAQAATTITVNNVTYVLGAGAPAAETITVDNNATVADVTIKSDETKAASIDSDKKLALGVDVLKTLAAGSYDVVLTANGVDKTVTVTVSRMAANNITASAYKAGENNTATLTLTLTSPIKGMDGVIADVTDAENWEIASCAAFSSGTAPAVTKAEVNAEGTQIILTLNIEGAGSAAADVLSFNKSPSTSFTIGTIANMTIA